MPSGKHLSMKEKERIIILDKDNIMPSQIAKELGIDRKTVVRHIKMQMKR